MVDWQLPKLSTSEQLVKSSSKFKFEKVRNVSLSANQNNFSCLMLSLDSREILQSLLKI